MSKKQKPPVNSNKANNEKQHYQCLTSLPYENDKHIDYVIVYKNYTDAELDDSKKKQRINRIRELFFQKLQKESLEIYDIPFKDEKGNSNTYALIHCPMERLLEELELLSFEIKLKNVSQKLFCTY